MDFKNYSEGRKTNLPPSLDAGTELRSITKVEKYTFAYEGNEVSALKVFADGKEYKTSSKVIIEQLTEYFADHKEALTNVRVVAPRGKRYLTLESL